MVDHITDQVTDHKPGSAPEKTTRALFGCGVPAIAAVAVSPGCHPGLLIPPLQAGPFAIPTYHVGT